MFGAVAGASLLVIIVCWISWLFTGADVLMRIIKVAGWWLLVSGFLLWSTGMFYVTGPRTEHDERFHVTSTQQIHSVEFSTDTNTYLVSYGEGSDKGIDKVEEIVDGPEKKLLKGRQVEIPWVIWPTEMSTSHDPVYIFPHGEIKLIK